ncbi:tetratricopeptide repeat protein, partial [Pseudoalteromonas byunsanensis]
MSEQIPAQASSSSNQSPMGFWAKIIALVAGIAAVIGYYDDIKNKGKGIVCDLQAVVSVGLECTKISKAELEWLEKLEQQGKLSEAQLGLLDTYRHKRTTEVLAKLEKLSKGWSAEDKSRTEQAVRETVEQGNTQEQQALELIAQGDAQAGFDLLAKEVEQGLATNIDKLRRLAKLSYGVSVDTSLNAYQKLYNLGEATHWDRIYLIRLFQSYGFTDKAMLVANEALALIPDSELRLKTAVQNELGDIQTLKGDLASAESSYKVALKLAQSMAERDTGNSEWQRDLSLSLNNLGGIQKQKGDLNGAEQSYLAALKIRQTLAERDPSNSLWQRDLSLSLNNLGDIEKQKGDLSGAEQSYLAALKIRQTLAKSDPSNSQWQRDLS